MKKVPILVLLFILIGVTLVLSACTSGTNSQGLVIGNPVPDFKLTDLSGQSVSLRSLRGKVVILNYWQVDCPPCKEEMPDLQATYNAWKDKGVTLLAINAGEDAATVKNFVESGNYTFPVVIDTNLQVAQKYNILYTPTTFILDKDGKLRYKVVGAFSDQAQIEKQFVGLLD